MHNAHSYITYDFGQFVRKINELEFMKFSKNGRLYLRLLKLN